MTPTEASTVVIGEAIIDIIVDTSGTSDERIGGSPLNVATGLARLGVHTELVTSFGDDDRGRRIAERLRAEGVAVTPHSIGRGPTSSARAEIDPHTGESRYTFDVHWPAFDERPSASLLVHVGSIAAFLSPGAADVRRALASRPQGVLASFDPNVRPAIIGSADEAKERTMDLASLVDVVKLSDEDAEWLFPGEDFDALRERFNSVGVALFAMTRGADGCSIASSEATVHLGAMAVSVVDTIGAGDAFMSGLLWALLNQGRADGPLAGLDEGRLLSAAHTALACAAHTVSRVGADPPTIAEVAALGHQAR